MRLRTFGCLLLALQTSALLHGQTSAQISGNVFDASNAVVPGASITATNVERQISRRTVSNTVGHYVIGQLDPGTYRLTVEAQGFRMASAPEIRLDVNQAAQIDVTLELGAVSEVLEVKTQAPLLEVTTAQLGAVFTSDKISDLPLNARNFTELLILTAGASPISVGQNATGAEGEKVGAAVYPSINGQQNRSNSFTIDGIYNNGQNKGTYAVSPNIDSLTEFKVQSHSDLAEFGGVVGGVVNIATKSGTNQFHGSLYEFLRNDAFDSRSFFNASKPALRQNQFGGSVGGPVLKNRTFFFFSYEGYRQLNPSSILNRIPTPARVGRRLQRQRDAHLQCLHHAPRPAERRQLFARPVSKQPDSGVDDQCFRQSLRPSRLSGAGEHRVRGIQQPGQRSSILSREQLQYPRRSSLLVELVGMVPRHLG